MVSLRNRRVGRYLYLQAPYGTDEKKNLLILRRQATPPGRRVIRVVRVVQKDPKDKESGFRSFVFGSLCTTLTAQTT